MEVPLYFKMNWLMEGKLLGCQSQTKFLDILLKNNGNDILFDIIFLTLSMWLAKIYWKLSILIDHTSHLMIISLDFEVGLTKNDDFS